MKYNGFYDYIFISVLVLSWFMGMVGRPLLAPLVNLSAFLSSNSAKVANALITISCASFTDFSSPCFAV
jgi:hypothetical protein